MINDQTNATTKTSGRKPYKDLTFTDDYMFCKILSNDPELSRKLLEVVLDKAISRVELVDPQHAISIRPDVKSVRFDVYLNDEAGTVFDLEMQALRKPEIPKRSRYYQSISDIDRLGSGMSYGALPDMYVIFICTFDPFHDGLPRYEFRNLCIENTGIELNDGTSKVFINAKSQSKDISPELRALLDYLCGMEPVSELTRYISASIDKAKTDHRWECEYVTFEEKLREEREAGRKEGREEGQLAERSDTSRLCSAMKKDGRGEEFLNAVESGQGLEALFSEYGIRNTANGSSR